MVLVLHVEAAAVIGMRAVGSANDGVGARDGGGPRIGAGVLVGDDAFHLNNRAVGGAVQKQVEPARSADVLHVAVRVGGGGVQQGDVGLDRRGQRSGFRRRWGRS